MKTECSPVLDRRETGRTKKINERGMTTHKWRLLFFCRLHLDCGHIFSPISEKCAQSRIGGRETKMTAKWKVSARHNWDGRKTKVPRCKIKTRFICKMVITK